MPGEATQVREWLVARIARAAGLPAQDVDEQEPFSTYGLESPAAAAISAELSELTGVPLAPTALFEHPTVERLAGFLAGEPARAGPMAAPTSHVLAGTATPEPLAVTGIACRLPGADGKEAFWRLLVEGTDAIREVPADRWDPSRYWDPDPAVLGGTVSKWGGFIDRVDQFDAGFFRISAQEATRMDPQQRLLLETAWEALEDAGETLDGVQGSATGVFLGISTNEYGRRQSAEPAAVDGYLATGNALSVAANRISYSLDLRGPSLAVDTACSSSLVALHLGSQALRRGECDRALVGGVNLLLDPEITIGMSQAGVLAADGRCKTFGAGADGYVRSEGVGVVVVKRLSAAVAGGDRIYAVVRGTAVNQDGRSNGLTAPSPAAQEALVRAACRDARVEPDELAYVECHGTGTLLGDPIEARALGAVVGARGAGSAPCLIGSVKTNVGHLEALAGLAGLIKVALSLHHGQLPPSLHLAEPNPAIPFRELHLEVVTRPMPFPPGCAGVSSFGFGGTNAHAILERAPDHRAVARAPAAGSPVLLPISARSPASLQGLAERWAGWLETLGPAQLPAVTYTASVRRAHHRHRLAVAGCAPVELATALRDRLAGAGQSRPARPRPRVGFVFSGQGAQWRGMARQLLASDPLFASVIRRCDEALAAHADWSIAELLTRDDERGPIDETTRGQVALIAIQMAIAAVWEAMGIVPAAVVGHSAGEIAAAHVAGALGLGEAVRLALLRGGSIEPVLGQGGMLVAGASEREAEALVAAHRERIDVAAVNDPGTVILSGELAALRGVEQELVARDRFVRWLPIDYASHGRQMREPARALAGGLAWLEAREPALPFFSSVSGGRWEAGPIDATYWARNLGGPVRFGAAAGAMVEAGVEALVEIGPHPSLRASLERILSRRSGARLPVLASLERDRDDRRVLLESLAELYALGCPVRWQRLHPEGGAIVSCPSYAWDRQRYWIERPEPATEDGRLRVLAGPGGTMEVRAAIDPDARVQVLDERGEVLMDVDALRLRVAPASAPGPLAPRQALYEVSWAPSEPPEPPEPGAGPWLLVGEGGRLGAALAARLGELGQEVLRAADDARLSELERTDLRGVVDLRCLGSGASPDGAHQRARGLLELVRAMASIEGTPPGLWLVTRGLHAVGTDASDPFAAPAWGLTRALPYELPALEVRSIDLEPAVDDREADQVVADLLAATDEPDVAYRGGARLVRRLVGVAAEAAAPGGVAVPIGAGGSYLITGGLGGLGIRLARWMVDAGVRHLGLLGRRAPGPDVLAELGALEALGATVHVLQADVRHRDELALALSAFRASAPPLRGVVHAAATVDTGPLLGMSDESLSAVLGPKVEGAWHLHELTAQDPLDWFVLFSSAVSVVGTPGLGNYCAANAFLDALAWYRRGRGLPAATINWGPWTGTGLAARAAREWDAARPRAALTPFEPDVGVELFARLLAGGRVQTVAMMGDVGELLALHPGGLGLSLVRDLALGELAPPRRPPPGPMSRSDLAGEYVPPRNPLEERIAGLWQSTLGIDRVGVLDNLFLLGGDSMLASQLLLRLERALGVRLDRKEAFSRLTVAGLAELAERDMVAQVQSLSDEEVARLLAESDAAEASEA